jgi:serpin B
MVFVLPAAGELTRVQQRFGQILEESLDRFENRRVRLWLPKVEFSWGGSLRAALRSMGVDVSWGTRAEFPKMTGRLDLALSDVKHATTLRVDEWGTEATALSIGYGAGYGRPPKSIEVRFDRPYLFAIVEETTGAILFVGRVANPSSPD